MLHKRFSQQEQKFIQENYKTYGLNQIAIMLNRTRASVAHYVSRNNIHDGKLWSQEEIDYLKLHYKDMTNAELSFHISRTKTAINVMASNLGLIKSPYNYNRRFFQNIDSEKKAYWLGFFMADGYVTGHEAAIELQADDFEHLKKFNKDLDGNIEVSFFLKKIKHYNEYRMCSIRMYCSDMVRDLNNHGVIENKSLVKQFPIDIDDNLMRHYIRGYFDGNGTIRCNDNKCTAVSFCTGSLIFAEGLNNYLHKIGFNSKVYTGEYSKKHTCIVRILGGTESRNNFLLYMYSNASVFLDRKYHKSNKYLHNCLTCQK